MAEQLIENFGQHFISTSGHTAPEIAPQTHQVLGKLPSLG